MRGNEFIRKVKKYAKVKGLVFEWRPERGKGSHGLLILGGLPDRGAQPER